MESIQRYFTPPPDHFFLLGPRGTGKTWLTQRLFPQALRVDLLEPETLRSLSARPERLRELIGARPEAPQVVIDEVQKLPELLEVAHLLIEEKRGVRFVFTGSSARKLRRGGVNLLGGRATQKTLYPFLAAELGPQFNLDEALRLGMTANAFDEDRQLCIDAGMNDHLSKPVDPQKLYETLLAWLGRPDNRPGSLQRNSP